MIIYLTKLIQETMNKMQNNVKNIEMCFSHTKNNEYHFRKKEQHK